MIKSLLYISYPVLGLLVALTFTAYTLGWFEDVALNLGTEVIGILLTVFLIDIVIRRHEEKERAMYKRVAFQQMRIPIRRHFSLLFGIYKASVAEAAARPVATPSELFDGDYFEQLKQFDFSKEAPTAPKQPWMNYLAQQTQNFKDSLSRTLEKYAIYLPAEDVDLIEGLLNSSFLSFLEQLPSIRRLDQTEGLRRSYTMLSANGMTDMLREHTDLFEKLTIEYEDAVPSDTLSLRDDPWRNDVAPKIGSARVGA